VRERPRIHPDVEQGAEDLVAAWYQVAQVRAVMGLLGPFTRRSSLVACRMPDSTLGGYDFLVQRRSTVMFCSLVRLTVYAHTGLPPLLVSTPVLRS
jgi:hypothetical protein